MSSLEGTGQVVVRTKQVRKYLTYLHSHERSVSSSGIYVCVNFNMGILNEKHSDAKLQFVLQVHKTRKTKKKQRKKERKKKRRKEEEEEGWG